MRRRKRSRSPRFFALVVSAVGLALFVAIAFTAHAVFHARPTLAGYVVMSLIAMFVTRRAAAVYLGRQPDTAAAT